MKNRLLIAISCDICHKEFGWIKDNSTITDHYFCRKCGLRNPLSQFPFCEKHPKKSFNINDKKCNINAKKDDNINVKKLS